MDNSELLERVKDLIVAGETDQALAVVDSILDKKADYKLLHQESIRLSALFNKTRKDEANSVVSFENAKVSYGQVTQGLLELLDFIETKNLNPASLQAGKPTARGILASNKWLILIGLPLLVLTISVFFLVKKLGADEGNAAATDPSICKVMFEEAVENFLILPFYRPLGDEVQPEGLIIERLEEFCASISLKSDFEICTGFKPDQLLNFEEAKKRGVENKAKIVIWGRVERSGTTIVVKTRFSYLDEKLDTIPFAMLKTQGEQQVATDGVLSIITSSGELTQDIEATLRLLAGMVANLSGNREAGTTLLQSAEVTDTAANLMKYMLLADNFIHKKEPEMAKAALDTCLDWNKNYWLGRNNRANLRIESGDYLGAIDDLSIALKKRPEDTDMLVARGMAYKKSQQLYQAAADYEKAIRVKPAVEPEIRESLKATKTEIKKQENIVKPTKNQLSNPNISKIDLINAAEASNKLGDASTTRILVTKGLQIDKNDPKLIAIQVDNLLKQKDLIQARAVLKAAVRRNVSKDEIAKHSKNVANFMDEMTAKKEFERQ